MKVKKEYSILVAIMVALVLYLVFREQEKTHYRLPKVPRVAGTEISKIEISKVEGSIILSKRDNTWYIDPKGYSADSRKIKDMLGTIEEFTLTALVSESKNYSRYHLGNDKKISVRAWAGNKLKREFEVGKAAPSFRHTFVKLAGDDRVYHARDNFRGKFDQTMEDLWDRTVLSFERTEIEGIHITKGEQSILLSRTEVPVEVSTGRKPDAEKKPPPKPEILWHSADGKKGDESAINSLLAALSNLRCQKYVEDRKKEDLKDPIYSIKLRGAEEYTLSIFAKTNMEAKSYPTTSSQSDFPFLLSDGQAEGIMKKPDEMLEKPEKS
jgi:hypothetical protein